MANDLGTVSKKRHPISSSTPDVETSTSTENTADGGNKTPKPKKHKKSKNKERSEDGANLSRELTLHKVGEIEMQDGEIVLKIKKKKKKKKHKHENEEGGELSSQVSASGQDGPEASDSKPDSVKMETEKPAGAAAVESKKKKSVDSKLSARKKLDEYLKTPKSAPKPSTAPK